MLSVSRLASLIAVLYALITIGWAARIDDCCCDTETVDLANQSDLHSLLEKIRATRFFKIFQLNLYNDCKFWKDESLCSSPRCSVCECTDEVPELWKTGDNLDMKLPEFEHWTEEDENWIVQDTGTMTFINLQRNPESYTGYSGEPARKIWSAMYGENCFQDRFSDMCYEKRVFFRLLSGLQACISAHVSYNHPLGDGQEWGPDPTVFNRMLGRHPERIQNIYFVFVFLLRAVNKMSDFFSLYDYRTGSEPNQIAEDNHTKTLMQNLLNAPMVLQCSPDHSFNENNMFRDIDSEYIKSQLRSHFRNLSLIMDCVHCDKCRVHGKLQILGIGTALKILFNDAKQLQRNEIIALINTLGKFSHGIWITREMQRLSRLSWIRISLVTIFTLVAITVTCCMCLRLITARMSPRNMMGPARVKTD